jgi:hypothetical protein
MDNNNIDDIEDDVDDMDTGAQMDVMNAICERYNITKSPRSTINCNLYFFVSHVAIYLVIDMLFDMLPHEQDHFLSHIGFAALRDIKVKIDCRTLTRKYDMIDGIKAILNAV